MPKPKKKTIKAWMLVSEEGEPIGTGQGFNEYYYNQEIAEEECKRVNHWHPLVPLNWKVIPIQITFKNK